MCAATAVTESALAIQANYREALQFNTGMGTACAKPSNTGDGCSGGTWWDAFGYIISNGFARQGALGEVWDTIDYARADAPTCPAKPRTFSQYFFDDWCAVRVPGSPFDMSRALVAFGPLWVAVNADSWAFWKSSSVWDRPELCQEAINHAVTLVGWDYEDRATQTKPYWIIRNSWGSFGWGDGGFMRLRRSDSPFASLRMCRLGEVVVAFAPKQVAGPLCAVL
jgi:hypothetical protein